ncbi:MAG: T9SS type A sorting domain-containing protein, partial [Candidatus Electryoneaceae bacterium]|nr:T9SS type A sorting domain-containing protein [Candidatus Electryoneaceae bacterium]
CFGWVEYDRPGWTVYGVAVVGQPADFNVAVPNSYIFTGGSNVWNDAEKFELMLFGFDYTTGDEVSDWSQMIGVGPLSLDRGDSVDVTFVLSAGDDSDDLAANIRSARDRWTDQRAASGVNIPQHLQLIGAYPSPFNGSLTVQCRTDVAGTVIWSLYDLAGREVVSDRKLIVDAGRFNFPIDGAGLASGRYLLTILQDDQQLTLPVTLIR